MRLKDAKEQIERERPGLTGSDKIRAIKELREAAKQREHEAHSAVERPAQADSPAGHESVGVHIVGAVFFLVAAIVLTQIWSTGSVLVLGTILELVRAYRAHQRNRQRTASGE